MLPCAGPREMNIEIQNARLVDASSGLDRAAPLFIANGKIACVGDADPLFRHVLAGNVIGGSFRDRLNHLWSQ